MAIKIPLVALDFFTCLMQLPPDRLPELIASPKLKVHREEYPHWDKIFHMTPPDGFTNKEWWIAIKYARSSFFKAIPLKDKSGRNFQFLIPDAIHEGLHKIDLTAGGRIGVPQEIINPETRTQYTVSSLIEEAITSSQLEGAATTREVAKEMLREHRPPVDKSERMILNNYMAMERIRELKNEFLSKDLILELQSILTDGTLSDASVRGRFRTEEENIVVDDPEGNIYHIPPPADELEERMQLMCEFANAKTPDYFIHPAIRAMILHFWLAYDHPFVDGNGRTARALFYWSMLHADFWLFEFLSISQIIRKAPLKYARAYLMTERDDNDLTYFLLYHDEIIKRSLESLDRYVQRKGQSLRLLERSLVAESLLNFRQRSLISHGLRHPGAIYSTKAHQTTHGISFHTARTDLLGLAERGLFDTIRRGRETLFVAPVDLEIRLSNSKPT